MNKAEIDIGINDAYYDEAMSFYKCGLIVQDSSERIEDSNGLFSPIVYLFRHSTELILKALIIKNLNTRKTVNWNTIRLAPHNKKLSEMHSLKALYDTWTEQLRVLNQNSDYFIVRETENVIELLDDLDFSSTFFRYPFNKQSERNRKGLVENIDEDTLSSLPCSLGAFVLHEGPEKFSCLHREQQLDNIEFEIIELIQNLIYIYNCMQIENE